SVATLDVQTLRDLRRVRVHLDHRLQVRIPFADAPEALLDQLHRVDLPRRNPVPQLRHRCSRHDPPSWNSGQSMRGSVPPEWRKGNWLDGCMARCALDSRLESWNFHAPTRL